MANTVAGIHLGPDTHANRPAATAVTSGSLYSCSDHDLIYRSDGSAWATWATLGGGASGPTVIRKSADESVTSSTTLQDDNDFTFAIGASEIWVAELNLYIRGAGTGEDLKIGFTVPAGATMRYSAIGPSFGATGAEGDGRFQSHTTSGNVVLGVVASGTSDLSALVTCSVANGATPGNVVFQWAQFSSAANAVTLLAGSWMAAHQVA